MNSTSKPQAGEAIVRVYNKGQRTIMHGEHSAAPGRFTEVPADVARLWKKLYPREIVDDGQTRTDLDALRQQSADKDAVIAAQKAKIAELEKQLLEMTAKLAEPPGNKGSKASRSSKID